MPKNQFAIWSTAMLIWAADYAVIFFYMNTNSKTGT